MNSAIKTCARLACIREELLPGPHRATKERAVYIHYIVCLAAPFTQGRVQDDRQLWRTELRLCKAYAKVHAVVVINMMRIHACNAEKAVSCRMPTQADTAVHSLYNVHVVETISETLNGDGTPCAQAWHMHSQVDLCDDQMATLLPEVSQLGDYQRPPENKINQSGAEGLLAHKIPQRPQMLT